jgi:hypothetical protein
VSLWEKNKSARTDRRYLAVFAVETLAMNSTSGELVDTVLWTLER